MKRVIHLGMIVLAFLLIAGCGSKTVKGNGNVVTESRTVSSFDAVKATGNLNLMIKADASPALSVVADDNLQQYIITKVNRNELIISVKEGYALTGTHPIVINIATSDLRDLSMAGSIRANVTGLDNPTFDLNSSGSSAIQLAGSTNKVAMDLLGDSEVDAKNLTAKEAGLDVSGTSKVNVYASKKLVVKISGSGEVTYYGSPPIINQAVFGSGKINKGTN